jgi:hypothetical protein
MLKMIIRFPRVDPLLWLRVLPPAAAVTMDRRHMQGVDAGSNPHLFGFHALLSSSVSLRAVPAGETLIYSSGEADSNSLHCEILLF